MGAVILLKWVGRLPGRGWRSVVRFWTEPIRGEPLALFRILLATTVMLSALISIAPNLTEYWMPDGLIPSDVAGECMRRTDRICILEGLAGVPYVRDLFSAEVVDWTRDRMRNPAAVYGAFVLWMTTLALLAAGFCSRSMAFVSWLLAVSFNHRILWMLNGGDDLAVQGLFYLIVAPSGIVWSLDAWRRNRRHADPRRLIAPWSVRLLQIQLCCVYFFTAMSKLDVSQTNDWLTGEALYWVLNDITLTRWSYASLPLPLILSRLASWGTIVFEFGFPLFVTIRPFRQWVLLAGVALHVGIWASMEIGWFSQLTICYYAVFLTVDQIRWPLRRIGCCCTSQR